MIWENPPERHRGPGVRPLYSDRQAWVNELKRSPMKWARWPDDPARASQLGLELRRNFPQLETVVRHNKLWARWVGGAGDGVL